MQTSQQQRASVPQERIGRYEVLRKIASGGMAELFLAKHVGMEGFEKVVAIKRILAHLAYDEEFINMFRDEARLVAKLSHQSIVQIYDLGKSNDSYFIAMEYIPGRNLASVTKKARAKGEAVSPIYIARCVAQACEALHYAHTRTDLDGKPLGIVHRDVSPQNIIVAFSGGVKLVDFGIAKAATKIAHTRAGVLKGKYAYMSPEQIKGEEIDARSDLFSVGIVLFELLCGKRPFEKENSIQTLKAIVQDSPVDPRSLNAQIPDSLAVVINRCLVKDRSQRYQNAQEIQLALEDVVSASGVRCNNVVIGEWLTRLFEDELERGKGNTMTFKGVGEVILPPSSERPEGEEDAEPGSPPAESPLAVAVTRSAERLPPADARPVPQAPSLRRRTSTRAGLIQEGEISSRKASPRPSQDDEATRLGPEAPSRSVRGSDHVDSARAIPAPSLSREYTPPRERRQPERTSDPYDDSMTEAVQESSPLHARLLQRALEMRGASPPAASHPNLRAGGSGMLTPAPLGGRPGALRSDGPGAGAAIDQLDEGTISQSASEFVPSLPELEAALPQLPGDAWNDKTNLNTDAEDEFLRTLAQGAGPPARPSAIPPTTEDVRPVKTADLGEASYLREPAAAALPWVGEVPSPASLEALDERGRRNTRPVGAPSGDGLSGDLPKEDEPWSDKTLGGLAPDQSFDAVKTVFKVEDTVGLTPEELAEKLQGAMADDALPQGAVDDDATHWGGRALNGLDQGGKELEIEIELPSSGSPKRDADADSRTFAAKSTDYGSGGVPVPPEGAFSYDPDETRLDGNSSPSPARSQLGAMRLAKRPAAPAGGVREVDFGLSLDDDDLPSTGGAALTEAEPAEPEGIEVQDSGTDEPTSDSSLDRDLAAFEYETEELANLAPGSVMGGPSLSSAGLGGDKPSARLPAPKPPAPPSDELPELSLAFEERMAPGSMSKKLPPLGAPRTTPYSPGASPSALDDLFGPSQPPAPLAGPDPLAAVGSTKVPPAAVSLSDVLLGEPLAPPADKPPLRGGSVRGGLPKPSTSWSKSSQPGLPSGEMPSSLGLGELAPSTSASSTPGGLGLQPMIGVAQIAPRRAGHSFVSLAVMAFVAVVLSAVIAALVFVKLRAPTLEITTEPPGAQVFVDGRLLEGRTPLSISVQPKAEYELKLLMVGYQPLVKQVPVPQGNRTWAVRFTLVPNGVTPAP